MWSANIPRLTPGTQFHYQSYHLVASDSVAEGSYLGQVEDGERVFTRIPPFKMEVPVGLESFRENRADAMTSSSPAFCSSRCLPSSAARAASRSSACCFGSG